MRNGNYNFRPSRRIYIPKADGRKRPLSIPSPRDKIVQEGMRMLLEIVFEDSFSNFSHGFRPGRGCHTALNQIKTTFQGVNWYIEGDIKACFDCVSHSKTVELIKEKVEDQAFIDLIYKYFKAGYGDFISPVKLSEMGVPQGGVLSPLLSNLYLHGLDEFVESELMPR